MQVCVFKHGCVGDKMLMRKLLGNLGPLGVILSTYGVFAMFTLYW